MSKAQILEELPKLQPEELAEVQAKLDELTGDQWQDHGTLSDFDKTDLDIALEECLQNPAGGSPWSEVKARIQAKLV